MWWSLGAGRRAIRGCLNPSLIFLGQDVKHVSFELKMYIFIFTGGRSFRHNPPLGNIRSRVAGVGKLSASAKNAFNSFVGRVFANSRQKTLFFRVLPKLQQKGSFYLVLPSFYLVFTSFT